MNVCKDSAEKSDLQLKILKIYIEALANSPDLANSGQSLSTFWSTGQTTVAISLEVSVWMLSLSEAQWFDQPIDDFCSLTTVVQTNMLLAAPVHLAFIYLVAQIKILSLIPGDTVIGECFTSPTQTVVTW